MYFSEEEDPPSDVDSTVTPIETVPGGDRLYGYLLESDDLSSLDVLVDRHRERRARRTGLGKEGKEGGAARLVTYGTSCDQSDAQVVRRQRHPGKLVTYGSSSDQSDGPADPPLAPADLQDIYKELQEINKKLREENRILQEREQAVRERERMVAISEDSINTVNDYQARQAWRDREQQHVEEVSRLEQQLREKGKETKRLKENFETLKLANDTLRKELEMLQGQHEKLEKQSVSLQARLTNLQRKQEYSQRQLAAPVTQASAVQGYTEDKQGRQAKQKEVPRMVKVKVGSGVYEMVGVLLGWVSDLHLRQTITEQPTRPLEAALSPDLLQEKCLKVLPNLAEVIRDFPGGQCSIYLPCLQFIYWSLLNLGQSQQLQKSSLSSTLRRLGEELYKPRMVRFQDEDRTDRPVSPPRGDRGDKSREAMFFRSSDLHTRFLSSLIILKTLTQADVLAHVFDCLRTDLKTNTGKDLFLYYQATPVVLPFLRPVHKTFLSSAVDIFLQMSMESSFLQQFLESCSNEQWFRTVAMALRSPSLDTQTLEKISIILQKLSKIRSNKKFFEVYTIVSVVQELVRGAANDSAFLSMNLKSILFNLGVQNKLVAPSR